MRKAQKQEVLSCIESLRLAHKEIKAALKQNNCSRAQNMLSECQDFVVSLGENIEMLEGEGHITVSRLEEYCEALYRIFEELNSAGSVDISGIDQELQRQLTRIEDSARCDIRIRTEVVFLPYKASMWDSLESVWKAADEDPDCDAYVIPIPYYDKNPDKSFRERHYEIDQYPEYVPVTKYEDYDFEKRKPDKIYIHNPYDNYNYMTSVEPFFYSTNLKQYTEQLVYIPYFILAEIAPDDHQAVDRMKHLFTLPGVICADQIIVQSENIKQIYVNVLTEAYGNIDVNEQRWENKILALGSPKIDKVLNTHKEDFKIPEEWLKIIQKPDGSWKKIVFYNTSVAALAQHNEKMLEKMRDVLSIFRENQEKVALLWRPHPLIEATIHSMRPQLWKEYEQIVREYRQGDWGIYDDTADMNRAIALSDAYYGDPSSIVQLYQKTGKPIMVQTV